MTNSDASGAGPFQAKLARFRGELKGPVVQILTINGRIMKDLEAAGKTDLLEEFQALQWAGEKLSNTLDEVFGPGVDGPEDLDVGHALRNLRSLLKPIRKTTKRLWSELEAAKERDLLVPLGRIREAIEEVFGAMDDRLVAAFLGLPVPPAKLDDSPAESG
jgi:hypothetical protein